VTESDLAIPVDITPAIECLPLREALLSYSEARTIQSDPVRLSDLIATLNERALYDVPALSSFAATPRTTKEGLRDHQALWLNRLALADELWLKYTTGTTGPPLPIPQTGLFQFDQLFLAPLRAARHRAPHLKPSATILALTDNPDCETVIWPNPWGGMVCQYYFSDELAAATDLSRTLAELEPDLITAKPSLTQRLATLSLTGELSVPCPILVSGADISAVAKTSYEQALGVHVIEAFGLTETGLIASDCSCGGGLAIDRDVAIEVLDGDERPVAIGEFGGLILTSLRNSVLPIVRYATGDTVSIGEASPQCNRGQHIVAIGGRLLRPFRGRDGRLLPAARFHSLFANFEITEFQMVQTHIGQLDVVVQGRDGVTLDARAIEGWIVARSSCDVRARVRLDTVDTSGKFQRYVSMID
jgi:phenylacetate-coenzyme A ligase PaaK-like adenylate-forming protein